MHIKYLQIFFITNIIVDRDVFKQKAQEHLHQESLSLNSDPAAFMRHAILNMSIFLNQK